MKWSLAIRGRAGGSVGVRVRAPRVRNHGRYPGISPPRRPCGRKRRRHIHLHDSTIRPTPIPYGNNEEGSETSEKKRMTLNRIIRSKSIIPDMPGAISEFLNKVGAACIRSTQRRVVFGPSQLLPNWLLQSPGANGRLCQKNCVSWQTKLRRTARRGRYDACWTNFRPQHNKIPAYYVTRIFYY